MYNRLITWKRESGTTIETLGDPGTIAYCEAEGFERVGGGEQDKSDTEPSGKQEILFYKYNGKNMFKQSPDDAEESICMIKDGWSGSEQDAQDAYLKNSSGGNVETDEAAIKAKALAKKALDKIEADEKAKKAAEIADEKERKADEKAAEKERKAKAKAKAKKDKAKKNKNK